MKFENTLKLTRPPQDFLDSRRKTRMGKIDALSADWRELVHEYGWSIVDALIGCGVKKANQGRHLIETILNESSPLRGSFSSQGERGKIENHLVLIPREPTTGMIEASMATIAEFDMKITKREKHRLRLKAALDAAVGAKKVR